MSRFQGGDFDAHRPAIKVCGLTRPEDVALCLELGVDFTGFIFAPGSPRRISPAEAAAFPAGNAARVGVFMGQPVDEVLAIMREARLDYAQLHGHEDLAYCRAVGPERVIKVLWPEALAVDDSSPSAQDALLEECRRFAPVCAALLLDSGAGGGGSGKEQARQVLAGLQAPRPWLLAGGLGPENVGAALEECTPWGVDCNSGVEQAPGLKDGEKLRRLLAVVRPGIRGN